MTAPGSAAAHCFVCTLRCGQSTCTSATCEMSAGRYLQADQTNWRHLEHCWLHTCSNLCTRIRLLATRRSFLMTGRCHGHTWRTSDRCGTWMNRSGHYPSTQTPAACSCLPRTVLWTYCTRRSTSCRSCVTASRTSACICHLLSAKSAHCCRSSSCLQCRQNHACTRPTYDWTRC